MGQHPMQSAVGPTLVGKGVQRKEKPLTQSAMKFIDRVLKQTLINRSFKMVQAVGVLTC